MDKRAVIAYSYMITGFILFITGFLILLSSSLSSETLGPVEDPSGKFKRANFSEVLMIAFSNQYHNDVYIYSLCQTSFNLESLTEEILGGRPKPATFTRAKNKRAPASPQIIDSPPAHQHKGLRNLKRLKSTVTKKLLHLLICSGEKLYLIFVCLISVCGSGILLLGCIKFYKFDASENGNPGEQNDFFTKVLVFLKLSKNVTAGQNNRGAEDYDANTHHRTRPSHESEAEYADLHLNKIVDENNPRNLAAERMCPFIYEELPAFVMNTNSIFLKKIDPNETNKNEPPEVVNMPRLPELVKQRTEEMVREMLGEYKPNEKAAVDSANKSKESASPKLPSSRPPPLKPPQNSVSFLIEPSASSCSTATSQANSYRSQKNQLMSGGNSSGHVKFNTLSHHNKSYKNSMQAESKASSKFSDTEFNSLSNDLTSTLASLKSTSSKMNGHGKHGNMRANGKNPPANTPSSQIADQSNSINLPNYEPNSNLPAPAPPAATVNHPVESSGTNARRSLKSPTVRYDYDNEGRVDDPQNLDTNNNNTSNATISYFNNTSLVQSRFQMQKTSANVIAVSTHGTLPRTVSKLASFNTNNDHNSKNSAKINVIRDHNENNSSFIQHESNPNSAFTPSRQSRMVASSSSSSNTNNINTNATNHNNSLYEEGHFL
jgi:hypothetical protein